MSGITRRFQQRALKMVGDVPPHVTCPFCHHGFDIVVSRRQMSRSGFSRRLFRFYRCRVCDQRFQTLNHALIAWPVPLAITALTVIGICMLTVRH